MIEVLARPARRAVEWWVAGERMLVRPIRACDTEALRTYIRELSSVARNNRFLGGLSELSQAEAVRFTRSNDQGGVALLIERSLDGRPTMVAEALCVRLPGTSRGEFALSVADNWRRQGLGTLLLHEIECEARTRGVLMMIGDMLRTNEPMKRLAARAGFSIASAAPEPRLQRVVKDLSALPFGHCDCPRTPEIAA